MIPAMPILTGLEWTKINVMSLCDSRSPLKGELFPKLDEGLDEGFFIGNVFGIDCVNIQMEKNGLSQIS